MANQKEVSKVVTVALGVAFLVTGLTLIVAGSFLVTSGKITYSPKVQG